MAVAVEGQRRALVPGELLDLEGARAVEIPQGDGGMP
jgi:hypothetical protein